MALSSAAATMADMVMLLKIQKTNKVVSDGNWCFYGRVALVVLQRKVFKGKFKKVLYGGVQFHLR
jgi:hypothetical protein